MCQNMSVCDIDSLSRIRQKYARSLTRSDKPMKTSELQEWLLQAKSPELQISPGCRIPALMPSLMGRTVLSVGHLAYHLALSAKRHQERGHKHRVMIHRDAEVIADDIPTDGYEGWEVLEFDGFHGLETWENAR